MSDTEYLHVPYCHIEMVTETLPTLQKPILITVQRDATQRSLFIVLQVHSTCFGCQTRPSTGVHKTVTAASGIGHIFYAATSIQDGQAWPRWRELAAVPEDVVTVLCTPDDGCG